MKRQYLIVVAAAAVMAAALLIATAGQTAEKEQQEEDQPLLDAVTRVDAGPLLRKIAKVESELALLRTVAEQLLEKMETMQESLAKMQEAVATLEQPEKWQYHLLYSTSSTAINRLGEQGWQLVTAGANNAGNSYLVFRKPAPEPPEE